MSRQRTFPCTVAKRSKTDIFRHLEIGPIVIEKLLNFYSPLYLVFKYSLKKKPEIKTKETNTLSWNLIDKKLAPPPVAV